MRAVESEDEDEAGTRIHRVAAGTCTSCGRTFPGATMGFVISVREGPAWWRSPNAAPSKAGLRRPCRRMP
jgi:hypothetical protein